MGLGILQLLELKPDLEWRRNKRWTYISNNI